MKRQKGVGLIACVVLAAAGCQSNAPKDGPIDQSRIVSVRPAVPDGARSFVEQQNKWQREQQKKAASRKQPAQPVGYGYTPAPEPAKPSWFSRLFGGKNAKQKGQAPVQPVQPVVGQQLGQPTGQQTMPPAGQPQ